MVEMALKSILSDITEGLMTELSSLAENREGRAKKETERTGRLYKTGHKLFCFRSNRNTELSEEHRLRDHSCFEDTAQAVEKLFEEGPKCELLPDQGAGPHQRSGLVS